MAEEDDICVEMPDEPAVGWNIPLVLVDLDTATFGDGMMEVKITKPEWVTQNRPGEMQIVIPYATEVNYNT